MAAAAAAAEEGVNVRVRECYFAQRGKIFLALMLEAPGFSENGRRERTNVVYSSSRAMSPAKFSEQQDTWIFRMRMPRPTGPEAELSLDASAAPRLVLVANYVVQTRKAKYFKPFGRATAPIDAALEELAAGKRVAQRVEFARYRPSEPPELVPASPTTTEPPPPPPQQQQQQQTAAEEVGEDEEGGGGGDEVVVGRLILELWTDRLSDTKFTTYYVHIHAAINLPPVEGSKAPSPFGLAKTDSEQRSRQQAKSTTGVAKLVHNAVWREPMCVDVPQHKLESESLFVAIVDHPTKRYLCRCSFKFTSIEPDKQYHLGLIFNDALSLDASKAKYF